MFATGVTMGLAEWIIDDTCLVFAVFLLIVEIYLIQLQELMTTRARKLCSVKKCVLGL